MRKAAECILQKISSVERGRILVNNDIRLTERLHSIAVQSMNTRPQSSIVFESESGHNLTSDFSIEKIHYANMKQKEAMETINSATIPESTRFRKIKILISKVIRTFTRNQIEFNQRIWEYSNALNENCQDLWGEVQKNQVQTQNINSHFSELDSIRAQKLNSMASTLQNLLDLNMRAQEQIQNNAEVCKQIREQVLRNSASSENNLALYDKKIQYIDNKLEKKNTETFNYIKNTDARIEDQEKLIHFIDGKFDNANMEMIQHIENVKANVVEQDKLIHFIDKKFEDANAEVYKHLTGIRAETFVEINKRIGLPKVHNDEIFNCTIKESFYEKKKANGQKIFLNIGSGYFAKEDCINLDIRDLPGVDIVASIQSIPLEDNSVDYIGASHIFEHFSMMELKSKILPEILRIMKKNAILEIVVPDINNMAKAYVEGKIAFERFAELLLGGQEYEGDFHYAAFSKEIILQLLEQVGLNIVFVNDGIDKGDYYEIHVKTMK